MDYFRIYDNVITRARTRDFVKMKEEGQYFEIHHIIPLCMGGNSKRSNLIHLTGREHYIAHQLLVKMYPNNYKLICSAKLMTTHNTNNRSNNKEYEWLKIQFSKNHPCKNEEMKNQIRNELNKYYNSERYHKSKRYLEKIRKETSKNCLVCNLEIPYSKSYCSKECLTIQKRRRIQSKEQSERQSNSLKTYLNSLTKEQMSERVMRMINSEKRGESISKGKKGKKTNQQYIMGKKYAEMSDDDFDFYVNNKVKPIGRNRIKSLRKMFQEGKLIKNV